MNQDNHALRVGVIGVGHMGRHHLRIVAESPDVALSGLYEPDLARSSEYSERYRCRAFNSMRDLLDASDAVVVAAPTSLHRTIGETCLAAGVHLLMEKPLAEHSPGAERLVDMAKEAGKVLMVGHVERYNPAIAALIELLREDPEAVVSIDTRRFAPLDGPRCLDVNVLYDLLIHDVDLVLEIADSRVREVRATGRSVFSSDVDAAYVQIEFEGRCSATLAVNRCCAHKMRSIAVTTPTRYLTADTLGGTLTVCRAADIPVVGEGLCSMGEIRSEHVPLTPQEPLRREFADFFGAISTGTQPVVHGERGLLALKTIEAIEAAMRAAQS
ncbi:MAG: Gfo/Idh/MocA family oxidoreductase [Thermodesulfobacteriota bacterium]